MIIKNSEKDSTELLVGDLKTSQMGIDISDIDKIMKMVSNQLYKNPREAIVRELTSNAYDATVDAGKNPLEHPVLVGIDNNKFYVVDKGTGISKDRMDNIITKFGKSTKEGRLDQIGYYGLGFKSPFAYTDSFTVESVCDGILNKWILNKNGSKFEYSNLSSESSTEENYTKIFVPIESDFGESVKWEKAIKSVLTYFKGCIYVNDDYYNSLPIVEGNYFIYRKQSSHKFSIVLDQVLYNLDPQDFGFNSNYSFPAAIKIPLDGRVQPSPQRESIIINNEAIDTIKEYLKLALEELIDIINKNVSTFNNLYEYLEYVNSTYNINLGTISLYFSHTNLKYWTKEFFDVELPKDGYSPEFDKLDFKTGASSLQAKLLDNYRITGRIVTSWNSTPRYTSNCKTYVSFRECSRCLYVTAPLSRKELDFVKYLVEVKKRPIEYIVNHKFRDKLKHYINMDFLQLKYIDKSHWRKIIVAWQQEELKMISYMTKFSDLKSEYDEWVAEQAKNRSYDRVRADKSQINIGLPAISAGASDHYLVFHKSLLQFQDFLDPKKYGSRLYIYSTDREELDGLYAIHSKKIIPVKVNKTDISKVEKLPNFVSAEEFGRGKIRSAKKALTLYMIAKDIKNNRFLGSIFDTSSYRARSNQFSNYYKFKYRNFNTEYEEIHKLVTSTKFLNTDFSIFDPVANILILEGKYDESLWKRWLSLRKGLEEYETAYNIAGNTLNEQFGTLYCAYLAEKIKNRRLTKRFNKHDN